MDNTKDHLSVVILTKDESANILDCLEAVCAQLADGDEALVVDAASSDDTVEIAQRIAALKPEVVRVHVSPDHLTFGAARNFGVTQAKGDIIVFVSADAVPEAGWLEKLRAAMKDADIVYGRQRHAPPKENLATVSRGIRYHHFDGRKDVLPETYASNVNAAYHRFAFASLRFDEKASGAEDVAFAKAARLAGLRIAYAPDAVVRHKDVTTLGGEWRKHAREGQAYAQLRELLGFPALHVAWAAAVAGLAFLAIAFESFWILGATATVFFLPTFRRLASPSAWHYHALPLAGAAVASPFFDLAFLGSYIKGRVVK